MAALVELAPRRLSHWSPRWPEKRGWLLRIAWSASPYLPWSLPPPASRWPACPT